MNDFGTPAGQRGIDPNEARLDALFRAYRAACEPREASANFMPDLWRKIEKTQSATFSFRRMAMGFVTAAAALTLALVAVGSLPSAGPQNAPVYTTYVEALAANNDALDARRASESVEYVQDLVVNSADSSEEPSEEI